MNDSETYQTGNPATTNPAASPWLRVGEAAKRARVGLKLLYREVKAGRLRAARVGGRRELRIHVAWLDEWLAGEAPRPTPQPPLGAEQLERALYLASRNPPQVEPIPAPRPRPAPVRGVRRRQLVPRSGY